MDKKLDLQEIHSENYFIEPECVVTIQVPRGGLKQLVDALGRELELMQGSYSNCMYIRANGICRFKAEAGSHGGEEATIQEVESCEVIISIPQNETILKKTIEVICTYHVHEEPTVRIDNSFGLRSKYTGDTENPNKYWNRSDKDELHGKSVKDING